MEPDILIVGAGPVGLFSAIETKLHNPALKIKIIERNEEYSRHHILRLEKESLHNSLAYKHYPAIRGLNGFVPTSDIENTFLNIAQALGVEIKRGIKITDSTSLLLHYPSAHTVIGADGAHSVLRKQLFGDEKIIDTNLQYIIELKYKAKGTTSRLSAGTYGPALGQVPYLLTENVGKEKHGETPVSLFIFVNESIYNEIRKKKDTHLADLKSSSKQMHKLLNTIRPWLSLRKEALNEEMIIGSEQINGVALNIFQSALFAKKIGTKTIYLVGDAAGGVPFYRALNAGLIAAAITAKTIALDAQPDLASLNKQLTQFMTQEINRAKKQNGKVNIGRVINYVLANVSKIGTGAMLKPSEEAALLNARIERTSMMRHHPRFLLVCGFGLSAMALFTFFTLPILPISSAFLMSIVGGVGVAVISAFLLRLMTFFSDRMNSKPLHQRLAPALPWENNDATHSLKVLNQLSVTPASHLKEQFASTEFAHYPSPLKNKNVKTAQELTQQHSDFSNRA